MDNMVDNYNILKQQAQFYNRNSKLFLEFEKEFGLNPWFLSHFRAYFSVKNIINDTPPNPYKSGPKILNLIKYFYFFLMSSIKVKSSKSLTSKTCVLSSAHFDDRKHLGYLKDNSFVLYRIEIPSFNTFKFRKINHQLKRGAYSNSNAILLSSIFSLRSLRRVYRFKKALNLLFQELEIAQEYDKHFLKEIVKVKSSLTLSYLEFLSFRKFFKREKFKSLVLYDENSPNKQVIWKAARKEGVQIFALQHGAIHDLNPAYNYSYYNEKPEFCNYTFIWGEHYKKRLVDYGYSIDSLNVVGAINNDILDIDEISKLSEEWRKKYNPSNKKVICYCSQPQKDKVLRKEQLLDVLNSVTLNDNHLLLIRPHPAEDESYFYDEIQNIQQNQSNIIMDKVSPLELHLQVSSALITSFSTVGIEYAKYYKPIIVLDYLEEDLLNYVKSGVGVATRNGDELKKLFESDVIEVNRDKYDSFMSDYYKKTKGNVTEEILNFISKMND